MLEQGESARFRAQATAAFRLATFGLAAGALGIGWLGWSFGGWWGLAVGLVIGFVAGGLLWLGGAFIWAMSQDSR